MYVKQNISFFLITLAAFAILIAMTVGMMEEELCETKRYQGDLSKK
jgi:hypothetical protein